MRVSPKVLVVGSSIILISLLAWGGSSIIVNKTTPRENKISSVSKKTSSTDENVSKDIKNYGRLYLGEESSNFFKSVTSSDIKDKSKLLLDDLGYKVSDSSDVSFYSSRVIVAEYDRVSILFSPMGQLVGFINRTKESPLEGYNTTIKLGDSLYIHLGLQTQGLLTNEGKPLISYSGFNTLSDKDISEYDLKGNISVMSSSLTDVTGDISIDGYIFSVDGSILAYKDEGSITYYYKSLENGTSPYYKVFGISSEKLNTDSVMESFQEDGISSYGIYSIGGRVVCLGL